MATATVVAARARLIILIAVRAPPEARRRPLLARSALLGSETTAHDQPGPRDDEHEPGDSAEGALARAGVVQGRRGTAATGLHATLGDGAGVAHDARVALA